MADDDDLDLDDDEYVYEDDDEPTPTSLASSPLALDAPETPAAKETRRAQDERVAQERELALWSESLPESLAEARYYGNLGLRLVKGIKPSEIRKMTVRDRVNASVACYDQRRKLIEEPSGQVNFAKRQDMQDALPALRAELERRQRERKTMDITPNRDDE